MTTSKYFKIAFVYSLCAFYSVLAVLYIIFLWFTKSKEKFWKVSERSVPPKCLQNNDFGEHKYVTANGIKIHYVEKGDHSKPLIIFVHGFPEFWYSWRHQLNDFSKDYWTVALDMRGYGETEKPKDKLAYKIDNLIDDIKALAEALGRKKFYLIAHDWGAVIAFHYVNQYMDTIEKFVCIGAPPTDVWLQTVFSTMEQFLKSWYVFFFQAPCLPEFMMRLFDLRIFDEIGSGHETKFFGKDDLAAYKYTFSKPNDFTYPINYYRNTLTPRRPFKKMTDDGAPGLYLLGDGEKFISKETLPKAQKLFKNLEVGIIPNANHFAQEVNPVETNRIIREFFNK